LTFEAFDLEADSSCGYDDVSMYDGTSSSAPLLKRVCGDSLPTPVQSKTNKMFVQFLTDQDYGRDGFKAVFTFVDPPGECILYACWILAK